MIVVKVTPFIFPLTRTKESGEHPGRFGSASDITHLHATLDQRQGQCQLEPVLPTKTVCLLLSFQNLNHRENETEQNEHVVEAHGGK